MKPKNKLSSLLVISLLILISISNISYNNAESSPATEKTKYYFQDIDNNISNWTMKPGYDNCTLGVPDFDQKQDDWKNIVDENWVYCGPVAALDCLWWLDCKLNNGTDNSNMPDFYGSGSHDPNNVIPLVDAIAENMSTEIAVAVFDESGTASENFTRGLYWLLDNWSLNDSVNVVIEGKTDEGIVTECVNYTNITSKIDKCADVILLLGFYCWDGLGFGNRLGGHYVQCNGYDVFDDNVSLSFSDPFFDKAELGENGWNSTHTHDMYENGSHNWTQNVSYDFYELNTSSVWNTCFASEVINYTNNYTNWSLQNQFESSYWAETDCFGEGNEVRTVIEKAWYIESEPNISMYKRVWDVESGTWDGEYSNSSVGETCNFNLTLTNYGFAPNDNLTIYDTHYDALEYYVPGSAFVTYPGGNRVQHEPDTTWENGDCTWAGHGHLTWCIAEDNMTSFSNGRQMYIEFNLTVNNTNYSCNTATYYVCEDSWCVDCFTNYTDYGGSSYACVNEYFNEDITCTLNTTENSSWMISEHVHRDCTPDSPCLDEEWNEYSTASNAWRAYNTSQWGDGGWRDWGWTYRFTSENRHYLDNLGLSYTIVNDSSMNRTQSVLRMKYNVTDWGEDSDDPAIGIIYSYTNDSYYHMVLFSWGAVYLLTKEGNQLYNTNDSSPVNDAFIDAYNYYDKDWSCNGSIEMYPFGVMEDAANNGIWAKTLWNPYCAQLNVKAWNITSNRPFGLCYEPSGWIYDGHPMNYSNETLTRNDLASSDALTDSTVHTVIRVYNDTMVFRLADSMTSSDDYVVTTSGGNGHTNTNIEWGPWGAEPSGGEEYEVEYITKSNISEKFPDNYCFGLVVWNPSMPETGVNDFYADFDFIESWKLNYSETMRYYENDEESGIIPVGFMDFKAFDVTEYLDYFDTWNTSCYQQYVAEQLTEQEYAGCTSCFYRNLTKLYTMNSRMHKKLQNCSVDLEVFDNQNDSVYYYSAIVTNLSANTNMLYNNSVLLQIIDTSDGSIDWGDGAIVCIDVDNNSEWDYNDMCFVWYDEGGGTRFFIWNGTHMWYNGTAPDYNITARFWADEMSCPYDWVAEIASADSNALLPSLHRYSEHRVYSMWVPAFYFVKNDHTFLNTTDTFGIHIMTIDSGIMGVPLENSVVVWEEWNETKCENRITGYNESSAWQEFLNISGYSQIEDFYTYGHIPPQINSDVIDFWGLGTFGNQTGYLEQDYYDSIVTKTANETILPNITIDQYLNYTIKICNNGIYNLTDVIINETFPAGIEVLYTNASSYWNPCDNTWEFNITWLNSTNCSFTYIAVNFTADCFTNGTNYTNTVKITADQPGFYKTASCYVIYGENTAPQINWTYPTNASTEALLIDNISCYIYDADGDTMNMTIYADKGGINNQTDVWTTTNIPIGNFSEVSDGHYSWNQTTNKSDRFATKWRWGNYRYNFTIKVTDGLTWTNETFYFTSGGSRYDINTNGDVTTSDISLVWTYHTPIADYLGLYDVNANGDITTSDISIIWANHS